MSLYLGKKAIFARVHISNFITKTNAQYPEKKVRLLRLIGWQERKHTKLLNKTMFRLQSCTEPFNFMCKCGLVTHRGMVKPFTAVCWLASHSEGKISLPLLGLLHLSTNSAVIGCKDNNCNWQVYCLSPIVKMEHVRLGAQSTRLWQAKEHKWKQILKKGTKQKWAPPKHFIHQAKGLTNCRLVSIHAWIT